MANIEEIRRLIAKANEDKAHFDNTIRWLQQQLIEETQRAATNELMQTMSVRQLALQVLRGQPLGIALPALVAELRKRGFNSTSDNPTNVVNTILNRAGRPFVRRGDLWFLEQFVPPQAPATPIPESKPSAEVQVPNATEAKS
ncbi:MAG: hypothetical protein ACREQI_04465 [Candidatus Binataceae bacterium]